MTNYVYYSTNVSPSLWSRFPLSLNLDRPTLEIIMSAVLLFRCGDTLQRTSNQVTFPFSDIDLPSCSANIHRCTVSFIAIDVPLFLIVVLLFAASLRRYIAVTAVDRGCRGFRYLLPEPSVHYRGDSPHCAVWCLSTNGNTYHTKYCFYCFIAIGSTFQIVWCWRRRANDYNAAENV